MSLCPKVPSAVQPQSEDLINSGDFYQRECLQSRWNKDRPRGLLKCTAPRYMILWGALSHCHILGAVAVPVKPKQWGQVVAGLGNPCRTPGKALAPS